jgi:hypothetical protein
MTPITIQSDERPAEGPRYRAISGKRQTMGRTAGEALDALNEQSDSESGPSMVIVQQIAADSYFSEAQYQRMEELMARRNGLTPGELSELEELARQELVAAAERTKAIADALGR